MFVLYVCTVMLLAGTCVLLAISILHLWWGINDARDGQTRRRITTKRSRRKQWDNYK